MQNTLLYIHTTALCSAAFSQVLPFKSWLTDVMVWLGEKGIEVNQKAMEVKCTHTGDNKVSETKSWGSDKTNEADKLLSRKKEN